MRKLAVLGTLFLAVWFVAGAQAEELGLRDQRSFDRFTYDTAVTEGCWAELAGGYTSSDTNATVLELRGSYAQKYWEVGGVLPYVSLDDTAGVENRNDQGLGDVRFYGKVLPIQTSLIDVGGGLEVSLPSGHEQRDLYDGEVGLLAGRSALGAGEAGFLPWVNASVHLNLVDVRAHAGYRFFADQDERWPAESWVYGGGLFAPLPVAGDVGLGLRAEFVAQTMNESGCDTIIAGFQPGVDIRIPADRVDIWLRPTGYVPMTDPSPDWGLGLGIAFNIKPE